MKKVLFVCYGGGHVKMVVPVARMLRDRRLAEVQILGLTTAADVVRGAGLPLLQIKDFIRAGDEGALEHGQRLRAAMGDVADRDETEAYLGLCYAELEDEVGPEEAEHRYEQVGRQAFFPLKLLKRIIGEVQPDLVCTTSSPRAERAAVDASRVLAIPVVCLIDLFAIHEVRWLGQSGYADALCVLNAQVQQFLLDAGRDPQEIYVTGNPAFDSLKSHEMFIQGRAIRKAEGWEDKQVVVWASQLEPSVHPSMPGRRGQPDLPERILSMLIQWQRNGKNRILIVRPHPSELSAQTQIRSEGVRWDGEKFELHALLHAIDCVVTMNSTVGLEGYLTGLPVIQVLGSLFDEAVPFARYGIATSCKSPALLPRELSRILQTKHISRKPQQSSATEEVLAVIKSFLN